MFKDFVKRLFKIEEKEDRTILQCLFYDVNGDLEEVSLYTKDVNEAKSYCRQIFNKNAELLIDNLVSNYEIEMETINNEMKRTDLSYNYCGIKRMQIMIKKGRLEGIENNNIGHVISKLTQMAMEEE